MLDGFLSKGNYYSVINDNSKEYFIIKKTISSLENRQVAVKK